MLEKDAGKRPCAADIVEILRKIERGADSATPAHTEELEKTLLSNSERPARVDEGFRVAVLPFKSRPPNADLEALAEGLSEDIVTGLVAVLLPPGHRTRFDTSLCRRFN
jgi:hypothetical protein